MGVGQLRKDGGGWGRAGTGRNEGFLLCKTASVEQLAPIHDGQASGVPDAMDVSGDHVKVESQWECDDDRRLVSKLQAHIGHCSLLRRVPGSAPSLGRSRI